ncbi:MAG: FAD-dependent oxidoreductase [Proteobacteria bacterium]|nr:FAD-dependent oxidoreductase [Pseudomonadota bacterium]
MGDTDGEDFDVIVLGGGGAGMTAAIRAADAGKRVALLEAGDRLGGSTALSGGVFYAAGTAAQRELGISDSADAMYLDILALNGNSVCRPALRRLCDEARETMEWLGTLGVEFPAARLSSPNGRSVPRSHEPVGFGMRIAECLDTALSQRPVDVVRRARAEKILVNEAGRASGVVVDGEPISCRAVVIATGGFGGDPAWVDRLLPKARQAGSWVWHVGNKTNRGDGLRMAEQAGAQILGTDSGLLLSTPNFHRDLEVLGPDWALMVNTRGERFTREDGAYWEIAEALEAQPGSRAFVIFDRAMFEGAKPHPRVLEALAAGVITVSWVPRMFEEQLAKGNILEAGTIEGLAERTGLPASALAATIERYNAGARSGADAQFGKRPDCNKPVATAPYYAVEVRPAILTVTGGGVRIDAAARVCAASGNAIPGLFAAGETVGSLYGKHYAGTGYAIASSITFGRVAGLEAAAASGR